MDGGENPSLPVNIKDAACLLAEITPSFFLLLNSRRELLYANTSAMRFWGYDNMQDMLGKRFGEIIGCENSKMSPNGCGSAPGCKYCSIFNSVIQAQFHDVVAKEVPIISPAGNEYVYRVQFRLMDVGAQKLVVLQMYDVSDEMRRQTMERVFYHDILNAMSGLSGMLELIDLDSPEKEDTRAYLETALTCSEYLIDEIHFSRNLSLAENGSLEPDPIATSVNDVMTKAAGFFMVYESMGRGKVDVRLNVKNVSIVTDKTLLVRVMINLIKNALEAGNDVATLSVDVTDPQSVIFSVRNKEIIPPAVKNGIFKRAVTTKGKGHGVGTYSVKLFVEQYLKGRVWCVSEPDRGTEFFVQIPKVFMLVIPQEPSSAK